MSNPRTREEIYKAIGNCNEAELTNIEVCKKCGGHCCQFIGCSLIPEDLPEESRVSKDALREVLMTGKYSLDYYTVLDESQKTCYDLHFIRMRNKYAPVSDVSYVGGACTQWSETTGCSLDFNHRPTQGKMLKPGVTGVCAEGLTKQEMGLLWEPYNEWLTELWIEFSNDIRKGIPKDEAECMFHTTGELDSIASGVTGIRLFKPPKYTITRPNEYLIINCENGDELLCGREYDAWVLETKAGVENLHGYTAIDILNMTPSERTTLMLQGWLPTVIKDRYENKFYLGESEGLVLYDANSNEDSPYINHWKKVHVAGHEGPNIDECLEWASSMIEMGYHPLLAANVEMLLKLYKVEEDEDRKRLIRSSILHIMRFSHAPII